MSSFVQLGTFKNQIPLHSLHSDFTKSAITLFLTEVFSKLLQQEQSPNQSLYAFTEASICTLDTLESGLSNFHIQFLLKLAPYLGFEIESAENMFSSMDKLVPNTDGHELLQKLLSDPYGAVYNLNKEIRYQMIESILHFYQHHAQISWPKSLQVLRSVLN